MKKPEECISIDEVRAAIDEIDKSTIDLISLRARYVVKAAEFKTSSASVRAEDRVQTMMLQRRDWAEESGLNPDFVESVFRKMVEYFIGEEMVKLQSGKK